MARQNAGLDSKQDPCTAQGVEDYAKDWVTKTEDDNDSVNYDFELFTAQGKPQEVTVGKEREAEPGLLGRGRPKKIQRVLFSPIKQFDSRRHQEILRKLPARIKISFRPPALRKSSFKMQQISLWLI